MDSGKRWRPHTATAMLVMVAIAVSLLVHEALLILFALLCWGLCALDYLAHGIIPRGIARGGVNIPHRDEGDDDKEDITFVEGGKEYLSPVPALLLLAGLIFVVTYVAVIFVKYP